MKKIIWMILLTISSLFYIGYTPITIDNSETITMIEKSGNVETEMFEEVSLCPIEEEIVQEPDIQEIIYDVSADITDNDIELLALVTMAEAEGECEEGKRMVIDTILNRVDSDNFPNTVYEVVYQPSQFSSMWNGRVSRCYIDDYICQLVIEELCNRMNYETIFFTADKYGNYGTPMFQIGNHYFSSGE